MRLPANIRIERLDHIAVVVKDIKEYIRRYWHLLGIGPWDIYYLTPPAHRETYLRGSSVKYSIKVGLAKLGDISYELIEPVEGPSVVKEFLESRGEGLHHIACRYDSLQSVESALHAFRSAGIEVLQCGKFHDSVYYYLDTEYLLGTVYEILYMPTEIMPNEVYPG
jgi:methylmalonyl-CoA/ethylmalonyl-CoA epimerase